MPVLLRLTAVVLALSLVAADPPRRRPQDGAIKVGDPAPALATDELTTGTMVALADLRGKPVVLLFGSCT